MTPKKYGFFWEGFFSGKKYFLWKIVMRFAMFCCVKLIRVRTSNQVVSVVYTTGYFLLEWRHLTFFSCPPAFLRFIWSNPQCKKKHLKVQFGSIHFLGHLGPKIWIMIYPPKFLPSSDFFSAGHFFWVSRRKKMFLPFFHIFQKIITWWLDSRSAPVALSFMPNVEPQLKPYLQGGAPTSYKWSYSPYK